MTELRALTSMRGLAAWGVVLFHLRLAMPWLPEPLPVLLAKGYLAVDFFFLLSGFVIAMTWTDRLRAGGWGAVPGFLQRRIARVWPLHAVMLGLASALALVLAAAGRPDPAFPVAELPLHLLLIQNWGLTDGLAWNDPAWSISAELGAYLLFPLLALWVDWRHWPSWTLLLLLVALFALLHAIMVASGAGNLNTLIHRLGLVRCVIEFAAGTVICALWQRSREAPASPMTAAWMTGGVLLGAALAGLPEALLVPPAFSALLLALALGSGAPAHLLEGRALHWLGEISYATYLVHFLLWKAFKLAVVTDPHAVPPPLILLYLLAVLAASAALYRWVERPAQVAFNGWSWRPARAAGIAD